MLFLHANSNGKIVWIINSLSDTVEAHCKQTQSKFGSQLLTAIVKAISIIGSNLVCVIETSNWYTNTLYFYRERERERTRYLSTRPETGKICISNFVRFQVISVLDSSKFDTLMSWLINMIKYLVKSDEHLLSCGQQILNYSVYWLDYPSR